MSSSNNDPSYLRLTIPKYPITWVAVVMPGDNDTEAVPVMEIRCITLAPGKEKSFA